MINMEVPALGDSLSWDINLCVCDITTQRQSNLHNFHFILLPYNQKHADKNLPTPENGNNAAPTRHEVKPDPRARGSRVNDNVKGGVLWSWHCAPRVWLDLTLIGVHCSPNASCSWWGSGFCVEVVTLLSVDNKIHLVAWQSTSCLVFRGHFLRHEQNNVFVSPFRACHHLFVTHCYCKHMHHHSIQSCSQYLWLFPHVNKPFCGCRDCGMVHDRRPPKRFHSARGGRKPFWCKLVRMKAMSYWFPF